jgi:hypothetical protein
MNAESGPCRPAPPAAAQSNHAESSSPASRTFNADLAMVAAFIDAHAGDLEAIAVDWSALKAEAEAQLERELAAARNWSPKVTVAPLTPWERRRFDRLLAERLANKPTVGAVKRRRDDAAKGPEYAAAALEGEADAVARTPEGLRHVVLNASAWTLARPELDALVTAEDIENTLVRAAVDAGLTERDARSVVRGALRRRGKQ